MRNGVFVLNQDKVHLRERNMEDAVAFLLLVGSDFCFNNFI